MSYTHNEWLMNEAEKKAGLTNENYKKLLDDKGCTEELIRFLIAYCDHYELSKDKAIRSNLRTQRKLLKRLSDKDLEVAKAVAKTQYDRTRNDIGLIFTGLEQKCRDGLIQNWGLRFHGDKVELWEKDKDHGDNPAL